MYFVLFNGGTGGGRVSGEHSGRNCSCCAWIIPHDPGGSYFELMIKHGNILKA